MKRRYRIANRKKFISSMAILLFLSFCIISIPFNLISADGLQEKQYREVIVEPGDTLWKIAEKANEGNDLRELIFEIEKANNLTGSVIVPGQKLIVPVKASK